MRLLRCEDESIDELAAYVGAGTAVAALTKRCGMVSAIWCYPRHNVTLYAILGSTYLLPSQRNGGYYELSGGAASATGAHERVTGDCRGVPGRSPTPSQPRCSLEYYAEATFILGGSAAAANCTMCTLILTAEPLHALLPQHESVSRTLCSQTTGCDELNCMHHPQAFRSWCSGCRSCGRMFSWFLVGSGPSSTPSLRC
jgi:hypothetical protein